MADSTATEVPRTVVFGDPEWTTAGGASTAYWQVGPDEAAVTVVAVHGFRGDHHGLGAIAAGLADSCRVVLPDLPGFGLSEPLGGEHTLDAYARWLSSFLTGLDAGGYLVLLGHSFGSLVAAAAVARHGADVARLVLINPIASPALAGPRSVMTGMAVGYYRLAAALPERAGNALLSSRLIVRAMSEVMTRARSRRLRRWIHDQHRRYFSRYASRGMLLEAFQASVRHTVAEFAEDLTCPTLLVVAERDDIAPLSAQMRLQPMIPDARLRRIPRVGHLIHYEAPLRAADHVLEFLDLPGAGR